MKHILLSLLFVMPLSAGWAEDTLRNLSLREKIGQLFVVATVSYDNHHKEYIESLITNNGIGGVIFQHKSTQEKQIALTNDYQALSRVPLLICQDAENGLTMRLKNELRFPQNMTLGAIQDTNLIYQMAREVGRQCHAIGVHMNFAPVVDVNNNPNNPVINTRSFGEDKERVAQLGILFAQGLQDAGVIACAKHFPGHGDTDVDSHLSLPIITHTEDRLDDLELYPFKQLIRSGVGAIMNAHLFIPAYDTTPDLPSSLSYNVVTTLLQNKLGFNGLVITDGLEMRAVTNTIEPGVLELKAFLAGNDILLCPVDVPKAIDLIEKAIKEGIIAEQELDRRVLKIMKAKESVGLANPQIIQQKNLITQEALTLKRALYEQAITLVGNKQAVPVSTSTLALQIGGEHGPFAEAFRTVQYLSTYMEQTEIDELIEKIKGNQKVVIGIFDMNKYARDNFGLSESTLSLIKELQKDHEVIITLFGSPYSLCNFRSESALVVAYEDGPDAQRAAGKVLLGELEARGRLPVTACEEFKAGEGAL